MKNFYGYEEKRIEKIKPNVEITPELEKRITQLKRRSKNERKTK